MTTSPTPHPHETPDPVPEGPGGLHVILGTGPVGCWTARALVDRGVAVRAVNRSGRRPVLMPEAVEVVAADATDHDAIISAATGAAVVYQALNPEYHRWHDLFPGLQAGALAAARATGARYVSIENLYMYDSSATITEDSPISPRSRKGALRQQMAQEVAAAHAAGEVRAAQLRSSDYFGPGVRDSAMGEMVFGRLLAGKSAQVAGSTSLAHSFAYVPDVGRAAAALGLDPGTAGRVWFAPHAPATTQGEMVTRAAGLMGVRPRTSVASPAMMRLIGLVSPGARETVEMMYEFTAPFVVDSQRIADELGLDPTPLEEALAATVAWYRQQA
jgi:nucleoside-diphosphate-sugar epimerase